MTINKNYYMIFDIERYLNDLPLDTKIIELSNLNLTFLPDLSKFKELRKLICYNNKLTYLPSLEKNENLVELYCSYNKLKKLPLLPKSIIEINCSHNEIDNFFYLPENLQKLCCDKNPKISTLLHEINLFLDINIFYNSGLHIINQTIMKPIKKYINTLVKFKYLFYCLKYKKIFWDLLWIKVREPKIKEKYNPSYLIENLDEKKDLDIFLNDWTIKLF